MPSLLLRKKHVDLLHFEKNILCAFTHACLYLQQERRSHAQVSGLVLPFPNVASFPAVEVRLYQGTHAQDGVQRLICLMGNPYSCGIAALKQLSTSQTS
jgi:hypothetical protein